MTPEVDQVANLCSALEFYGDSTIDGELLLVRSAVSLPVFNMAVLLRGLAGQEELDRRVQAAARFFKDRGSGWSFWLCEGLVDRPTARRLNDLFDRHSMSCVADTPGMELERLPPPARPLPELQFKQASSPGVLQDFSRIVALSFNVPANSAARLYSNPNAWGRDLHGWVGYEREIPISTAVTAVRAGVIGIYSVATQPSYRRRGYAEAVMRHAMAESRLATGIETFVLQSSPAGRNLYRQMGFRKISRFLVYATPG